MDHKQEAINTCSCPHVPWEGLLAPLCRPYLYLDGEEGTLFVNSPPGIYCVKKRSFGDGSYCVCKSRLGVYREFGI